MPTRPRPRGRATDERNVADGGRQRTQRRRERGTSLRRRRGKISTVEVQSKRSPHSALASNRRDRLAATLAASSAIKPVRERTVPPRQEAVSVRRRRSMTPPKVAREVVWDAETARRRHSQGWLHSPRGPRRPRRPRKLRRHRPRFPSTGNSSADDGSPPSDSVRQRQCRASLLQRRRAHIMTQAPWHARRRRRRS